MLQYYASLCVRLNGDLLLEQCGVIIDDHVNRRCRITVSNALPEKGAEVDSRMRLGERVKFFVYIMSWSESRSREPGPALVEIEGPIIASRIEQNGPNETAQIIFTVEQEKLAPTG